MRVNVFDSVLLTEFYKEVLIGIAHDRKDVIDALGRNRGSKCFEYFHGNLHPRGYDSLAIGAHLPCYSQSHLFLFFLRRRQIRSLVQRRRSCVGSEFQLKLAPLSGRGRVARIDKVVIFGRDVTGEASFVQGFTASFAIREVGKSPAAGRGVLF
jgi:hypothetical protein